MGEGIVASGVLLKGRLGESGLGRKGTERWVGKCCMDGIGMVYCAE